MTCCWWCCHTFEGQELHLPYKKNQTMGVFCSWECMKSFAIERFKTGKSLEVFTLMTHMRKVMTGKVSMVESAPSRYSLKMFGGPLSIEEFRKTTEKKIKYVLPDEKYKIPIVIQTYKASENTQSVKDVNEKMASIQNSVGSSNTLKLKRNKPLQRDVKSVLEVSLGITRKS